MVNLSWTPELEKMWRSRLEVMQNSGPFRGFIDNLSNIEIQDAFILALDEIERLRDEEAFDDEECDGTPFALPAYWRGHDQTVASLCQELNKILDGKDDGRGVANEPWESVRRRLLKIST